MGSDVEKFTEKIATGLAAKKESEIKRAITHVIGNDEWTIADITGRGAIKILPDKTEIFSFDGVDLIHFGHMRTEIDNKNMGIHMTVVQEYRLLYQ
jgi:hypothetical protein